MRISGASTRTRRICPRTAKIATKTRKTSTKTRETCTRIAGICTTTSAGTKCSSSLSVFSYSFQKKQRRPLGVPGWPFFIFICQLAVLHERNDARDSVAESGGAWKRPQEHHVSARFCQLPTWPESVLQIGDGGGKVLALQSQMRMTPSKTFTAAPLTRGTSFFPVCVTATSMLLGRPISAPWRMASVWSGASFPFRTR